MENIIELKNIDKVYKSGKLEVRALSGINISIKKGEVVAIMGPSGSGKSTLMNILGLLDRPTYGEFMLDGKPISLNMSDRKLAKIRSEKIGFIFQSFNLLPKMSALENVTLPSFYSKKLRGKERVKKAKQILESVGLATRIKHKPSELSGGEKQRVAIARSLTNDPEIILADEPTGNLDSKSGTEVMKILTKLNKEKGKTLIIITHDQNISKHCQRVINLLDGQIKI